MEKQSAPSIREEVLITLTRDHLLPSRENKDFWEIEYTDFAIEPWRIQQCSILVFKDDGNRAKVLKDRPNLISNVLRTSYGIKHNKFTPEQVYKIAVKEMEFTDRQIKSKWRKVELVQTRAAICIVLRTMFGFGMNKHGLSLREIGQFVGGIKHSTVLSYWKKHREEQVVSNRVERIQYKLSQIEEKRWIKSKEVR